MGFLLHVFKGGKIKSFRRDSVLPNGAYSVLGKFIEPEFVRFYYMENKTLNFLKERF